MSSLQGQTALITGGGSGIGLACAAQLARDGAAVVLAGRSAEKLEAAAAGLRATDAEVHTVVCDVTDEAQVAAACEQAAAVGRFTMVVANAGSGSAAPLHLTTLDDWNSVMATNLTGAFLTIKHSAMGNVRPMVEVKSRRVGGANYQVPVEVRPARRAALAMRWLRESARKRSEKSMGQRLAAEMMEAAENRGGAVKKRDEVHRMADANKAFAHFRF